MPKARFITLSLLLDAVLVNVGFVAAYYVWLWFRGTLPDLNLAPYLTLAPFVTVGYLASGYVYELYSPERTENAWAVVRAVVSAVTIGTLLFVAAAFFKGGEFFVLSRGAIVLSLVTVSVLLVGWRLLFLRFGTITWPTQRVLLLGTGALACELATELDRRAKWGYQVEGFVSVETPDAAPAPDELCGHPVFGGEGNLTRIISEKSVDRLIVVSPVALRELVEKLVLAEELAVTVDVVPELYEVFIGRIDSMVGDIPLMQITRRSTPEWFAAAKRTIDFAAAIVLLVVLSPVLLLAALAILLTMGAPVVFKQERVGRELSRFNVYKFRTMVRDAEKLSGPVLAEEDDPRITPVGRFLRKTRIDELLQLFNILSGHMSFVGPRPERPFFVEQYLVEIPGYRERFRMKPGVTGLAQVMGGYATTPGRKLKYDLIYLYHQSLAMDVQILVETLRVVLTGRGAR
ncbi:MAG TPA: sugar transferase [Coriobacteriia bacterium]|nr:sugar transferase [Coriobacteriia bacterium]